MISPDDIASTIEYLLPGFIAIKVFTFFGLRSSRTDLELTLWSLAASVVLGEAGLRVAPGNVTVAALLIGVVVAGVAAYIWRLNPLKPLRTASAPRARDAILQSSWVQVAVSNGDVLSGRLRIAAEPTSEEQDIYIDRPAWIFDGAAREMGGTAGVLIPGGSITYIQILGEAAD